MDDGERTDIVTKILADDDLIEALRRDNLPSLDQLFAAAVTLGRLTVFHMDDGTWHAKIELPTRGAGVTASVRSGFDHATPNDAVQTVVDRALEARNHG